MPNKTAKLAALFYSSGRRGKTIVRKTRGTESVSHKQWLTLFVLCLAVFVVFGAFSSLLIPQPRAERRQAEWQGSPAE
jgi:hypothetical protein